MALPWGFAPSCKKATVLSPLSRSSGALSGLPGSRHVTRSAALGWAVGICSGWFLQRGHSPTVSFSPNSAAETEGYAARVEVPNDDFSEDAVEYFARFITGIRWDKPDVIPFGHHSMGKERIVHMFDLLGLSKAQAKLVWAEIGPGKFLHHTHKEEQWGASDILPKTTDIDARRFFGLVCGAAGRATGARELVWLVRAMVGAFGLLENLMDRECGYVYPRSYWGTVLRQGDERTCHRCCAEMQERGVRVEDAADQLVRHLVRCHGKAT